ncbi:unnamed protein product [Nippostrongylus brasiliensis]|uniref:DUF4378 domain-containing protein n=1 Tax=Nippostrongylus brasiliensis TaxID=27835 RepID=A0A158R1D4_NIPBR|nr:unnamed protein product [Nippostrongylus brasiliensis]
MKPKRRSTFSPARADTTLKSPRAKRKRLDSSSPSRRKSSNSSDEVKPPPEFIPFRYEKLCPKLQELLGINSDEISLDKDDLLTLQHELEKMLAHSADYMRRAHGEVTYLNTGDYPVQDLRTRPMPVFKVREFVPVSPTATKELHETLCGLPEDDKDDNLDIWPPHHIPQRFWTWCKEDFLTPIDAEYLKNFKAQLLDKYDPKGLKDYFVNEPWKHRKRHSNRLRLCSSDLQGSRSARRSSVDVNSLEKRNKEKDERSQANSNSSVRKASGSLSTRQTRAQDSKLAPLISDVVFAASREMRKDDMSTPVRRSSIRLHSLDDCEDERKTSIKSELTDVGSHDSSCSEFHGNGFTSRSPLSSRMHSPRIKRETRDEEDEWDRPGPSTACPSSSVSNGRCNGELKTRPRRNGEIKRENGIHSVPCDLSSPSLSAASSGNEEGEVERHYREIGSRIVKMLVQRGLIPSSTEHVYREIATGSISRDDLISREGKDDDDDSDLDEVSEELLRCQMELQELEPRLRGVISHCWSKVRAEFAYWETSKQLDDADTDLFRLGVNMYRELPTRRLPISSELPTLRTALCRRNRKARQHYGSLYKRLPKYRKRTNGAASVRHPFSADVMEAKSSESKKSSANRTTSVKVTAPSVAAPEFEDRNEQDEGGKGEEDPDANVDEGANAAPPADDVAVGEGVAKEDTEPVKGKDKEENQLGAMVEDAKGNVPVPQAPSKPQTRVDLEEPEDSHFMTFAVVGMLLVFCLYLLHHNKKKILGLVFEGRATGPSRRNVRYRRLSQRDDHEAFKEDVIY